MCRMTRALTMFVLATIVVHSLTPSAGAQNVDLRADDGTLRVPRFLIASANRESTLRPVDIDRSPSLSRRIAVDLDGASIGEALETIAASAGFRIGYSAEVIPRNTRVHLRAQSITVAAALTDVLSGAGIDVVFSPNGGAALMKRPPLPPLDGAIRGTIVDADGGASPVPSAYVTVIGRRLSAQTDSGGRYVIRGVPAGEQSVRFTRIGYTTQTKVVTVPEGGEAVADFRVTRSATQLEQVVVTVTGSQRTAELGHTVSHIATDSVIKSSAVYNVADMLTSRVPGAMVNAGDGLTGNTPPIRLRGLNSFTVANDPIVIVDGARIEATNTTFGRTNRLADISMLEIESMEVSKGPSAATLYGTDAANGVIIIRTKRGSAGRTRWEAFAEVGALRPDTSDYPDNTHGWGRNSAGAVVACPLVSILAGSCVQDSVSTYSSLKDPSTTPITTGNRRQVGLQASGGAGQFKYLVSGGFEGELGWMKMPAFEVTRLQNERGTAIPEEQLRPNGLSKINLRGNASMALGSRADLNVSNGLTFQDYNATSTEAFRSGYWGLGYKDPVYGGYSANARIGDNLSVRQAENLKRYIGSAGVNYRATDWLALRTTLGVDLTNLITDDLQRNGEGPLGANRIGSRRQRDDNIGQYSLDAGATVSKNPSAALSSRTSVGLQYNRRGKISTSVTGVGLPPGSETVAGATTISALEVHEMNIVVGSYIDQQFGWRDRLFLNAAIRADGSSSFGKDLRTTAYPKFGASWIASQEPFFPKIPGLTSLRLRSSWGSSGVQPPSTAGISTITLTNAIIDGVSVNAATRGLTGNPEVRPERQTELEFGFDIEAFDGRIRSEVTQYSKRSDDALVLAPFAASVGGGNRYANLGQVTNKGTEVVFNLRAIQRTDVALEFNVTGSVNRNKLESVGPNAPAGYFYNSGFAGARHKVGYPLYGGWQKPITGYSDANGDGIIGATEVQVGPDEIYLGPTGPTKQVTGTTTLALLDSKVRLNAMLDWRGGFQRLDYTRWVGCALFQNCPGATTRNANLAEQAAIQGYNVGNTNYGFWSDGAYTRLREVSVGISVPRRLLSAARAASGDLNFAGRNLVLWSNWSGGDPEVAGGVGGQNTNPDLQFTFPAPPLPRVYVVRLNLSY